MEYRIHVFILFACLFFNKVHGGTVTAQRTNVTGIYENDLTFGWIVATEGSESAPSFKVIILPDDVIILVLGDPPILTADSNRLFGDRISAAYTNGIYLITLKNVTYTDSRALKLEVLFRAGSSGQIKSCIVHVNVEGGPNVCGLILMPSYVLNDNDALVTSQDICGYPQPYVQWKLEKDSVSKAGTVSKINNATRQYRYTFRTRAITRKDCGTNIIFTASGRGESVKGQAFITVAFTPSAVTNAIFYYLNDTCIFGSWSSEDTGNCNVAYQIQFNSKHGIYNVSTRELTICIPSTFKNVEIWAVHMGNVGEKIRLQISVTTPKPTTTLSTVVTSTQGCAEKQCECENNNDVIVGTIVAAVLIQLLIIIFVVLMKRRGMRCDVFKRSGDRTQKVNEEQHYENPDVRSPNYAELNIRKVKPSVYAALSTNSTRTNDDNESDLTGTQNNPYADITV